MEEPTLFRQKADGHQTGEERTKEQALGSALGITGVCLAVTVGAVVLHVVLGKVCGMAWCILPIVAVCGALCVVVGLILAAVQLLRPTKTTVCPGCNTELRIYSSVCKYMCPTCRTLLLLGKDRTLRPRPSPCPYCRHSASITSDHGTFLCPGCGMIRQSHQPDSSGETEPCPACEKPVPRSALYCAGCDHIMPRDLSDSEDPSTKLAHDMDWLIGKTPRDHLIHARVLVAQVRRRGLDSNNLESLSRSVQWLAQSLMSLEEAYQEERLRPAVLESVPHVDVVYADLLRLELAWADALAEKKLKKAELSVLASEPHITARKQLERALGGQLAGAGGIGEWQEELLVVSTDDDKSQVTGHDGLKSEAQRFADWRATRSGPS